MNFSHTYVASIFISLFPKLLFGNGCLRNSVSTSQHETGVSRNGFPNRVWEPGLLLAKTDCLLTKSPPGALGHPGEGGGAHEVAVSRHLLASSSSITISYDAERDRHFLSAVWRSRSYEEIPRLGVNLDDDLHELSTVQKEINLGQWRKHARPGSCR